MPNCLLEVTDHVPAQPQQRERDRGGQAARSRSGSRWIRRSSHRTLGLGIWEWASSDEGGECDVVMACCGDVPTLETLAAVDLMRTLLPDLQVRVINVVDLMRLQPPREASARHLGRWISMRCSRRTSPSSSRFTATRG